MTKFPPEGHFGALYKEPDSKACLPAGFFLSETRLCRSSSVMLCGILHLGAVELCWSPAVRLNSVPR